MWAEESVMYQIYPLGMCGAPFENAPVPDDAPRGIQSAAQQNGPHRILRVLDWIPHLQRLGVTCVMFNPLFESDTHGYNTRDYRLVDTRLGTNEDFRRVCDALHAAGIRILLDGVFNHCGRGFGPFRDVQARKWDSPYHGWFNIHFDGNSPYNDGFWYEGWEGNYDLVRLNLDHPDVRRYLLDSVGMWIDTFGIDGLRLDVAYMLNRDFLMELRRYVDSRRPDFYLIGEILHGDYRQIVNPQMCDSATNYECCKGLWSSFNSMNLFEINHSLMRQFGPEPWCLYRGMHLLSFADNHDVTRAASILNNPRHLPLLYALMFGMPGIPCLYYGSEWGITGHKNQGDPALRPAVDAPQWNGLTDWIAQLSRVKKASEALNCGGFRSVVLTTAQCIFERQSANERILVAVNAGGQDYTAHFDAGCARAVDLITGQPQEFGGNVQLPGYSAFYWQCAQQQ